MITDKVLGDGETMVVQTRTHWKELFLPGLIFVVTVAVVAFAITLVPTGDYDLWVKLGLVGLGALIIIIWVFRPWLIWFCEEYAVTDQRLITRSGVFTRNGRDIPLHRINDVTTERQLSDRFFGCGTLVIWSAGQEGEVRLIDIPRVEATQRTISEQLFRNRPDDERA